MTRYLLNTAIFLAVVLIIGCAGSSTNPVTPSTDINDTTQSADANSRHLWGLWDVTIDGSTMEVEIVPARGLEFTANVTRFLQPPSSPVNLLSIALQPGSDPSSGYFVLDITVQHPFPGAQQFRGFDVRGIFYTFNSVVSDHDPSVTWAASPGSHLLNPDGYTRWWNPDEFTSFEKIFGFTHGKLAPPIEPSCTLNGYKYFTDDLDAGDDQWSIGFANRGTFGVSSANSRRYEIQFKQDGGSNVFDFNYAIDASWSQPDPAYSPDFPVEAYDLMANCREAYAMSTGFDDSTAWWTNETTYGGDLHIDLEVGDWGALEDGVTVPDEISEIWIESKTLFDEKIDIYPLATVTDGNSVSTSVFSFDITDVSPSGTDDQEILVSVIASHPSNYEPQVPGGDNFDYPDIPLTAYMMFNAPIIGEEPVLEPDVIAIDPVFAFLNDGNIPVVLTGQHFAQDAEVSLVKNNDPGFVIDATLEDVNPGGTEIDCFINSSEPTATAGIFHVVVTNPGPMLSDQLDDGFRIYGCNEVYSEEIYEGEFDVLPPSGLVNPYTQDIGFLPDGRVLVKDNNLDGIDLKAFDVTQNGFIDGDVIIDNMLYGENYILASVDVCDLTGNIVYVASDNHICTYTSDGTLIQDIDTQNTGYLHAVDTDEDGGIWALGHSPDLNSAWIVHYTWDVGVSDYVYDPIGTVDVTSIFGTYVLNLSGGAQAVFDMAISYGDDRMFVFKNGTYPDKGELICFDLSSGLPTHDAFHSISDFLPNFILTHTYIGTGWNMAADIEIDHSDPNAEACRMIVMERCSPWEDGTAFVKMNTDGEVLLTLLLPDSYPDEQFHSIGINPNVDDEDGTFLVGVRDHFYGGYPVNYHVYAVPEGW